MPQPRTQRLAASHQGFSRGEERRCPHVHLGNGVKLKNQDPKYPQNHAEKNVATHQWIAPLPRQQPTPGNNGLRPVAPHPRFDRHIKHPGHARNEQPRADRKNKEPDGVADAGEVAAAEKQTHFQRQYHQRQAERSFSIASSPAVVPAGKKPRPNQQRTQQDQPENSADPLSDGFLLHAFHTLRLRPVADERKEHRLARKRGRFHPQRTRGARPGASPCHPCVASGQRRPSRLRRL